MKSGFAAAWSLAVAPVVLFIPALILAGMGPCAIAHPLVLVAALLFFVGFELVAVWCFVRSARSTGRATGAMVGIGLSLLVLGFCVFLEYAAVAEYWYELKMGFA
jgi:uncharacterized membrane protein